MKLDGARMTVTSSGPGGDELNDHLPCEHSPVTLPVDQALIERLWGKCPLEQMGANRKGLHLASATGDISYLMSAPTGSD
jgi:hypothetical protein